MAKLVWDDTGKRHYETGLSNGVLFVMGANGSYGNGVAWNGLTAVTESPSGAEPNPQYADNIKYLNLISAEDFGGTIEAFTYPDEFAECDGSKELSLGVTLGQQTRKTFALVYKSKIGNDVDGDDHGYKIHIVYGATAAPSERARATVNESPEAMTFSWEFSTVPVAVAEAGFKPTAYLEIDSTKITPEDLAAIEDSHFGTTEAAATLLLPDAMLALITATVG